MTNRTLEDVRIKLSALWVARMLSGFLGDVLRFTDPVALEQTLARDTPVPVTEELLVGSGVFFALPIFMVVFSLTLKSKASRWANIILGTIFVGFDLFFLIATFPLGSAVYEIAMAFIYPVFPALIVWYAWRWPQLVSPSRGLN